MADEPRNDDDWARQADAAPRGMLAELWGFLKANRKWWLLPLVLSLLLVGALALLGGSPAAPFIYTLF